MTKIWVAVGLLLISATGWAQDENNKILKDALVGAVTGAVAAEATKEDGVPATNISPANKSKKEEAGEERKGKKAKKAKKEKKRPYGWDQGKKTGWGESDVPPGQKKKNR